MKRRQKPMIPVMSRHDAGHGFNRKKTDKNHAHIEAPIVYPNSIVYTVIGSHRRVNHSHSNPVFSSRSLTRYGP
jgi:hypothetical protein